MTTFDWKMHNKARAAVEMYYQTHTAKGNINIPKYDLFVTEVRKDYERCGFDLNDEGDLFRLWGILQMTCEGGTYVVLKELSEPMEQQVAISTWGTWASMTGLFLREMTKNVPSIPAIEEAASE